MLKQSDSDTSTTTASRKFEELRQGSKARRQINEFGESRLWGQAGKVLCVWLIYKHAETLINHPDALIVLLGLLILPEIAKKIITMYFSRGQAGFTRRTETHDSSVEVVPSTKTSDKKEEFT